MDSITTQSLNKNNVLTTKYFESNSVFADYIETSSGNKVEVSSIATDSNVSNIERRVTYLEQVCDGNITDINDLTNEMISMSNKIDNTETTLNSLSLDVQNDLYSPIYQDESQVTRLTALTNYIENQFDLKLKNFVEDGFCAVVNVNVTTTLNGTTLTNIYFKDLINDPILAKNTILKNLKMGEAELSKNNDSSYSKYYGSPVFYFYLDISSLLTAGVLNDLSIKIPDTILNLNDGLVYKCSYLSYRTITPLFNSSNVTDMTLIVRRCGSIDQNFIFNYFLSSWSSSNLTLVMLSSFIISNRSVVTSVVGLNKMFSILNEGLFKYMRLKPQLFFPLAADGSTLIWGSVLDRTDPSKDGKWCSTIYYKASTNSSNCFVVSGTPQTNSNAMVFYDSIQSNEYKMLCQFQNMMC